MAKQDPKDKKIEKLQKEVKRERTAQHKLKEDNRVLRDELANYFTLIDAFRKSIDEIEESGDEAEKEKLEAVTERFARHYGQSYEAIRNRLQPDIARFEYDPEEEEFLED